MAESNEEADNWWGGWLKTVQEKSSHAWDQMRRDLGEFGTTIQKDTAQAAASTATLIRDRLKVPEGEEEVTTAARMKVGFSNLLTGLSESLTPEDRTQRREDEVTLTHKDPHVFDKARARLHAMQTDPTTYCSDPDGHPDFREWLETFDVDTYKGDISELLVANTEVRALYTKLVPAAVSHVEFWGRYFYRVQQLKQDEARRRALKERADMTSSQKFEEEDLGWGDEEDTWDTVPDAVKNQSGVERYVVLPEGAEREMSECETEGRGEVTKETSMDRLQETSTSERTDLPDDRPNSSPNDDVMGSNVAPRNTASFLEMDGTEDVRPPHNSVPPSGCRNSDLDHQDSNSAQIETESGPSKEKGSEDVALHVASSSDHRKEESPEQLPAAQPQVSSPSGIDAATIPTEQAISLDTGRSDATDDMRSKVTDLPNLKGLTVETGSGQDGNEVSPEKTSPAGSEASNRESTLSDDWEKDFDDIEVTKEDLKNAPVKLTSTADDDLDDDWESWE